MGAAAGAEDIKTISVAAMVVGEMRPEDIPLSQGVDLAALKAGDEDPLEVVVEVPAGRSKRRWNYMPSAIQAIANHVQDKTLSGFLGHQKPEDVESEFKAPVTHWVGAAWIDGKGYFRGVVDAAAKDLKRWIRAKRINQVSIYGIPKLVKVGGETQVVDYLPLSIDWTPLDRAGMSTRIVAIGEMYDEIAGEFDGSHEELKETIRKAAKKIFGDGSNGHVWVRRVFDAYVIVEHESQAGTKLYNIPYGIIDDEVKLGEKTEVVEVMTYEPVGEIYGGEGNMTWKELVAQLKTMLTSKEVTLGQVAGEMGWQAQEVAGEIDSGWLKEVTGAANTLGKVEEALGVSGEMDIVALAAKAREALDEKAAAGQGQLINEVLKEKVNGEMAHVLVKKMLVIPEGATKEQVAGEIDKVLSDPALKDAMSKLLVDRPVYAGGAPRKQEPGGMVVRRVSI